MSGMNIIGVKFKNNQVYVPEVLIAARAMNAGIAILRPLLVKAHQGERESRSWHREGRPPRHRKESGQMMMEGKGLEVIDLGTDVTADKFVASVKEHDAGIVACSALLTTTMTEMKNVVDKIKEAGLRDKVTIMVGGAPVTDNYCKSIGADIYSPDAASAAERALAACV